MFTASDRGTPQPGTAQTRPESWNTCPPGGSDEHNVPPDHTEGHRRSRRPYSQIVGSGGGGRALPGAVVGHDALVDLAGEEPFQAADDVLLVRPSVTCPAGHTRAVKSGAARFGALCSNCPLRVRCTTSVTGRSVTVDAHHRSRQANKDRWADPATRTALPPAPAHGRTLHSLAHQRQARRVPYRGVAANHLWLTHRAAAVNLVRLTNLGITCTNGALTI